MELIVYRFWLLSNFPEQEYVIPIPLQFYGGGVCIQTVAFHYRHIFAHETFSRTVPRPPSQPLWNKSNMKPDDGHLCEQHSKSMDECLNRMKNFFVKMLDILECPSIVNQLQEVSVQYAH